MARRDPVARALRDRALHQRVVRDRRRNPSRAKDKLRIETKEETDHDSR